MCASVASTWPNSHRTELLLAEKGGAECATKAPKTHALIQGRERGRMVVLLREMVTGWWRLGRERAQLRGPESGCH